jgi:hypothetical protein
MKSVIYETFQLYVEITQKYTTWIYRGYVFVHTDVHKTSIILSFLKSYPYEFFFRNPFPFPHHRVDATITIMIK